jgi:hypothetical protein
MHEEYFKINREMYEYAKANDLKVLQQVILDKVKRSKKLLQAVQQPTQLNLFDQK